MGKAFWFTILTISPELCGGFLVYWLLILSTFLLARWSILWLLKLSGY